VREALDGGGRGAHWWRGDARHRRMRGRGGRGVRSSSMRSGGVGSGGQCGVGWVMRDRAGRVGARRVWAAGGWGEGSVDLLDRWVQVMDLWSITIYIAPVPLFIT
jgi:hypothetical protein